jgi:hypothetical protein
MRLDALQICKGTDTASVLCFHLPVSKYSLCIIALLFIQFRETNNNQWKAYHPVCGPVVTICSCIQGYATRISAGNSHIPTKVWVVPGKHRYSHSIATRPLPANTFLPDFNTTFCFQHDLFLSTLSYLILTRSFTFNTFLFDFNKTFFRSIICYLISTQPFPFSMFAPRFQHDLFFFVSNTFLLDFNTTSSFHTHSSSISTRFPPFNTSFLDLNTTSSCLRSVARNSDH